jgi:hypothetical protein
MSNPPRIWLDYRPVRIGWVISGQDVAQLGTAATWNACLWGGRQNCIIPAHDTALADRLVACFSVDLLLPVRSDAVTTAFIGRFPHLKHHSWRDSISHQRGCEFADIRHAVRRIVAHQDQDTPSRICHFRWEDGDALHSLLTLLVGRYPAPNTDIPNYKGGVQNAFGTAEVAIGPSDEIPTSLLETASPLDLTTYDLTLKRNRRGWLGPGVVLGSVTDFDALAMFWNLRAAGTSLIFYDQAHGARLKAFANAYLAKLRGPSLSESAHVNIWIRRDRPRDDSWRPDLVLGDLPISLCDGRGDGLWNGMNIEPQVPQFSAWHRDVVPMFIESEGKANASFALPDRPFSDEDIRALSQKFAVVVDASQFGGPDAQLTFETPFVPRLNEFYGRKPYHDYDAARSQLGQAIKRSVRSRRNWSRRRRARSRSAFSQSVSTPPRS